MAGGTDEQSDNAVPPVVRQSPTEIVERVRLKPDWLTKLGIRAWAVVGIALASAILYVAGAGLSGLVIPLVVAAVVGALFVPLVDKLAPYMPRSIAAGIVLVGLIVIGIGSIVLAVRGISDQVPEIRLQLESGIEALSDWLDGLGLDLGLLQGAGDGTGDWVGGAVSGLGSYAGTVFSSVTAFVVGTFVGVFLLYYILVDWKMFSAWLGSHLGVPKDLGTGIVDDSTWSIRRYFYALTITSAVTAVSIGGAALVMGLPLAFTIGLVTFVTSYVPYLGAFVSGAFAVLIALGVGGIGDALIILIVVLVVQMALQPLLQNRMTASELDIHPVVAFGSTIVGGVVAGVLGATLSAPTVAIVIKTIGRMRDYKHTLEGDPPT